MENLHDSKPLTLERAPHTHTNTNKHTHTHKTKKNTRACILLEDSSSTRATPFDAQLAKQISDPSILNLQRQKTPKAASLKQEAVIDHPVESYSTLPGGSTL